MKSRKQKRKRKKGLGYTEQVRRRHQSIRSRGGWLVRHDKDRGDGLPFDSPVKSPK